VRRKFFFLIAAILWTVLVIYLSLAIISVQEVSLQFFKNQDKIVHFTFYFVFTLLWFESAKRIENNKKRLLLVIGVAILLGIIMELCQGFFTNYRSPDIWDIYANSLGALLAGTLINRFRLKKT
jgi:VanZ family protein